MYIGVSLLGRHPLGRAAGHSPVDRRAEILHKGRAERGPRASPACLAGRRVREETSVTFAPMAIVDIETRGRPPLLERASCSGREANRSRRRSLRRLMCTRSGREPWPSSSASSSARSSSSRSATWPGKRSRGSSSPMFLAMALNPRSSVSSAAACAVRTRRLVVFFLALLSPLGSPSRVVPPLVREVVAFVEAVPDLLESSTRGAGRSASSSGSSVWSIARSAPSRTEEPAACSGSRSRRSAFIQAIFTTIISHRRRRLPDVLHAPRWTALDAGLPRLRAGRARGRAGSACSRASTGRSEAMSPATC